MGGGEQRGAEVRERVCVLARAQRVAQQRLGLARPPRAHAGWRLSLAAAAHGMDGRATAGQTRRRSSSSRIGFLTSAPSGGRGRKRIVSRRPERTFGRAPDASSSSTCHTMPHHATPCHIMTHHQAEPAARPASACVAIAIEGWIRTSVVDGGQSIRTHVIDALSRECDRDFGAFVDAYRASRAVRKSTTGFGAPEVFVSRPHLNRFGSFLDEARAAGLPSTPVEELGSQ